MTINASIAFGGTRVRDDNQSAAPRSTAANSTARKANRMTLDSVQASNPAAATSAIRHAVARNAIGGLRSSKGTTAKAHRTWLLTEDHALIN